MLFGQADVLNVPAYKSALLFVFTLPLLLISECKVFFIGFAKSADATKWGGESSEPDP